MNTGAFAQTASEEKPFDPYSAYKSGDFIAVTEPETLPIVEPDTLSRTGGEADIGDAEIITLNPSAAANPKAELATQPLSKTDASLHSTSRLKGRTAAPFYLTAEEYLRHRGDAKQDQFVLRYTVTREPAGKAGAQKQGGEDAGQQMGEQSPQKARKVTIILGQDFAAVQSQSGGDRPRETLRIYDFKLERFVEVSAISANETRFSSASLYANVHRNVRLVGAMTKEGTLEQIDSGGAPLESFWLESALGYSAAQTRPITNTLTDAGLTARFGDQDVVRVSFASNPYPFKSATRIMQALAHHYWPVHPQILDSLKAVPNPIAKLEVISKAPDAPDGFLDVWTLDGAASVKAGFPLPAKAISVTEGQAVDPLAKALRGAFLAVPPTSASLSADFTLAMEKENWTKAWLAAQRAMTFIGPCPSASPSSKRAARADCLALDAIEARADLPADLTALIKAFSNADDEKTRGAALQVLGPQSQSAGAHPMILYKAGLTRAKMTREQWAQAKASFSPDKTVEIDAQKSLITALIADPHNPAIYVSLAQFFAASGNYEASWDAYDALRALPAPPKTEPSKNSAPINTVEARLRAVAPAYFLSAE